MNPNRGPGLLTLPAGPFLYAIIDASMAGARSLTEWVRLLSGPDGAAVVQWRFRGLTDAAAFRGASELRAATRETGVLLFINDRPDIARMVEADGVHVGQEDLDPIDVRALLPDTLIGVSTHNQRQFNEALGQPVNYIAVGPIFGTTSKEAADPVVGIEFVSWAKARTTKPLVAIGGLNETNAAAVVAAGADGIAVISELMKAGRPKDTAAALARITRPGAADNIRIS